MLRQEAAMFEGLQHIRVPQGDPAVWMLEQLDKEQLRLATRSYLELQKTINVSQGRFIDQMTRITERPGQ